MKVPEFLLENQGCRIGRLSIKDAAEVAAITDDSVTGKVDFLPHGFDQAAAVRLIQSMDRENSYQAVRRITDGALIGVIGVHAHGHQQFEIGYWFAAGARGQGHARSNVTAVVRHLAAICPGCAIVAECAPGNVRSWALLRDIGFSPSDGTGRRAGRRLLRWYAEAGQRIDVC